MRTNYVVCGYVCMAILSVFADNEQLFPRWPSGILWIGLVFCFTKLAFPSETAASLKPEKPREVYLNSPKPSAARSVSSSIDFSRNFCRQLYLGVKAWKRENPYNSWDHPEAVEVFDEFSATLDKHLEEFPEESQLSEVQQWIGYANEIRKNRD